MWASSPTASRKFKNPTHNNSETYSFYTKTYLKQDKIHLRAVMLRIVSTERSRITSQRRSTTFSKVEKTSFRKPILRSCFQICSIGFISGVYGGIKKSLILSGITSVPASCHAAPSQQRRMMSVGNCFDSSLKKIFIQTVLQ